MSGGLPFWIIVLLCWSMSSQLITWTSSFVPVFCWYFCAKSFQNFAVLLLEYSAATSLIEDDLAAGRPAAAAAGSRTAAARRQGEGEGACPHDKSR